MVFGLSEKEKKARRVSKLAEDVLIGQAVAKERVKQRLLEFERRKARAIERVRRPPLKVFGKKVKGVAVRAGKRARKDIGRSIEGFAQQIGKQREEEKETLVILGGRPRRVKGRVRVITPPDTGLGMDIGGDLGLSVDLLGEKPKKRRKKEELEPIRFF